MSSKKIKIDDILVLSNPFNIHQGNDSQQLNSSGLLIIDHDLAIRLTNLGLKLSVNHALYDILQSRLSFANSSNSTNDGDAIQRQMEPTVRKMLAANFTDMQAARFIGHLASRFETMVSSVADPFAGSGRLLKEVQNTFSKRLHLFASEIYPESAFATLKTLLELLATEKAESATVFLADAFDLEGIDERFDMIVMNPPFTRRHRISENTHQKIKERFQIYQGFLRGQPGLHVYSLFLSDMMLRPGGILIAVLPAATFTSDYSRGIMQHLLNNYHVRSLYSESAQRSFSDGSKIREIILVAKKISAANARTEFTTLKRTPMGFDPIKTVMISQKSLMKEWNWLRHFGNSSTDFDIPLHTISELKIPLIRGLEMYGPDFFVLPNRGWTVVQETSHSLLIKSNKTSTLLDISKTNLVPVLRKPSHCKTRITPLLNHWMLALSPRENLPWIEKYVEETGHLAETARKNFGNSWLTHVHKQVETKDPFGYLFVVDKFGFRSVGTFSHFLDGKVSATKNFYLFKTNYEQSKLLGAWLSSSLFLLIYFRVRRVIGRDLGRLQISDYKREPLFIDPNDVVTPYRNRILQEFDLLRQQELPTIEQQIVQRTRLALDRAWIDCLNHVYGLSLKIDQIYSELQNML
ncbi:MAG: class I SAM-dependent methyltransferase [Methanobacteriota archaeon]|nr:MAG: class I SAM-dependent methyltransferase [Euryarchaeota archaeon]